MAILGIQKSFNANHGTFEIKNDFYTVRVEVNGPIKNCFVAGVDYDVLSDQIENVCSFIEGKYLDEIMGRATIESIALYFLYNLRETPVYAVSIYEVTNSFVKVYMEELDGEHYPAILSYNHGISEMLKKKFHVAIELFSQSIEIWPEYAQAFNLRGRCYKYLENYSAAKNDYLQAIRIAPNYGEAYRNLGNAYYYLGILDKMLEPFNRAVDLLPKSAVTFNNRGFVLQKLGRFNEAVHDHNAAIELDPKYEEAYLDRAAALEALGNEAGAAKDYEMAKSIREIYGDKWKEKVSLGE